MKILHMCPVSFLGSDAEAWVPDLFLEQSPSLSGTK
jgi:hypothetical protein